MTAKDAYAALPADAKWSCSFGFPGRPRFEDWYRTADGTLIIVSNGTDEATRDDWKVERPEK